jgi:ElaB/YqjD/DUF883 family membrane-anchored ribosome-binding protein
MTDRATTEQDPGQAQDTAQTPDLRQQARELGTQVREHVQELGAQVRNWTQEVGDQLKEGAQQAMRQAETSASQLSAQGREAVGEIEKTLEDYIRAKPLQSLMMAAGVGIIVGLLWRK